MVGGVCMLVSQSHVSSESSEVEIECRQLGDFGSTCQEQARAARLSREPRPRAPVPPPTQPRTSLHAKTPPDAITR